MFSCKIKVLHLLKLHKGSRSIKRKFCLLQHLIMIYLYRYLSCKGITDYNSTHIKKTQAIFVLKNWEAFNDFRIKNCQILWTKTKEDIEKQIFIPNAVNTLSQQKALWIQTDIPLYNTVTKSAMWELRVAYI